MRGKVLSAVSDVAWLADHPRLCGEKSYCKPWAFFNVGSPPPMRGKARKSELGTFGTGITPAYAGKRY